jgi:hypothetical protein
VKGDILYVNCSLFAYAVRLVAGSGQQGGDVRKDYSVGQQEEQGSEEGKTAAPHQRQRQLQRRQQRESQLANAEGIAADDFSSQCGIDCELLWCTNHVEGDTNEMWDGGPVHADEGGAAYVTTAHLDIRGRSHCVIKRFIFL